MSPQTLPEGAFHDLVVELTAYAVAEFSRRGLALCEAHKVLATAAVYAIHIAALRFDSEQEFRNNSDMLAIVAENSLCQACDLIEKSPPGVVVRQLAEVMSSAEMGLPGPARHTMRKQIEMLLDREHGAMALYRSTAEKLLDEVKAEAAREAAAVEPAAPAPGDESGPYIAPAHKKNLH